jgi:signal transduction histidine kinase
VLVVRTAAVLLFAYVLPLDWQHVRDPGWAVALATGLVAETAVVCVWWLRAGPVMAPLLLDVPVTAAALLGGSALVAHGTAWTGYVLWVGLCFPYSVVIASGFGLVCRSAAQAVAAGVVCGAAALIGAVGIEHRGLSASLFVVVPYLIYPVAGRIAAVLITTGLARIDAAREIGIRQAADLATEQERVRQAQALHDRVLQTMEALVRRGIVADPRLHERLVTDAAWLRRFIETGQSDQSEDVSVGLAAAARAVAEDGVDVEYHDATLRAGDPYVLSDEGREALIEATHGALADLTAQAESAVVRAQRQDGGVLVSILVRGPLAAGAETGLDRIRTRLNRLGGRLTVEPTPYAEIWVPSHSPEEGGAR